MTHAHAIDIWTITFNPLDVPGKYVARKHMVPGGPTDEHHITDTLEAAREKIPPYMVNLGRDPMDIACIAESWI